MTIRSELRRFEKRWVRPIVRRLRGRRSTNAASPQAGAADGAAIEALVEERVRLQLSPVVEEQVLLRSEIAALRNRFLATGAIEHELEHSGRRAH